MAFVKIKNPNELNLDYGRVTRHLGTERWTVSLLQVDEQDREPVLSESVDWRDRPLSLNQGS